MPSDGSSPHEYRGKLSILQPSDPSNWKPIPRDRHMYVLVAAVSNMEKTFRISPASRPLDGKLRVVHFGPLPADIVMSIMMRAYQDGKHVEDERIGYEDIEGLRIEFHEEDERWRRVCVDGKIVAVENGGWLEVRKSEEHVLDLVTLD